jgi:hypothetical protein
MHTLPLVWKVFSPVRNLLTVKLQRYAVLKVTVKLLYVEVFWLGYILAGLKILHRAAMDENINACSSSLIIFETMKLQRLAVTRGFLKMP